MDTPPQPEPGRTEEHRPTLSLCMIVKDEERLLPGCLESVRGWVDEVVVCDTGSRDATVRIAERAGARVVRHPWGDDFAAARNAALEHASGDWILQLDADERLAPGSGPVLRRAIEREERVTVPERTMRRVLGFLGAEWDGAVLEHHRHEHVLPEAESSSEAASRAVYTEALERWRGELQPDEVATIERRFGELLGELGYL